MTHYIYDIFLIIFLNTFLYFIPCNINLLFQSFLNLNWYSSPGQSMEKKLKIDKEEVFTPSGSFSVLHLNTKISFPELLYLIFVLKDLRNYTKQIYKDLFKKLSFIIKTKIIICTALILGNTHINLRWFVRPCWKTVPWSLVEKLFWKMQKLRVVESEPGPRMST